MWFGIFPSFLSLFFCTVIALSSTFIPLFMFCFFICWFGGVNLSRVVIPIFYVHNLPKLFFFSSNIYLLCFATASAPYDDYTSFLGGSELQHTSNFGNICHSFAQPILMEPNLLCLACLQNL